MSVKILAIVEGCTHCVAEAGVVQDRPSLSNVLENLHSVCMCADLVLCCAC